MFRFLTPKPGDPPHPLQTGKTAAAWFRQLSTTDAIGRQLHVIRTLGELRQSGRPLEFDNVAAIAFLDTELSADRGRLLTQYVDAANGSGAAAERIWQAASDLCAAFIVAYGKLLDEALANGAERRWRQEIPRLIARLVHYFGTDAKLRALRGERWIPAKWQDLHRLYRRAIDLGVERVPLVDRPGGAAGARSIEQEYILVLLTQVVNTGTLAPSQLEWTLAQLRVWSRELTLETTRRPASSFAVNPGGRKGLERCHDDEAGEGLRYLDTGPLALQIDRGIAALRRPAGGGGGESAGAPAGSRIAVLEKVRAMVSPDTARAVSREPRAAVAFDADVRIGLAHICRHLAAGDLRNSAFEAWAAGASGDAAGVAVPSRTAAATSPGTGAGSIVRPAIRYGEATTWRVQNRSNSGLLIRAAGAISEGPALGSLVAVWPREGGDWALGVVRRMVRTTRATVDAGVSVIAQRFAAVTLHAKRQARDDMGFVVDGVDVSTIGASFDGIYLPPPSRPKQPLAAKSLVIPTSEYVAERNLVVIAGETVYAVVLRELIERRADWSWVVIEIVGRTGRG